MLDLALLLISFDKSHVSFVVFMSFSFTDIRRRYHSVFFISYFKVILIFHELLEPSSVPSNGKESFLLGFIVAIVPSAL
jgi:hypothetical protein